MPNLMDLWMCNFKILAKEYFIVCKIYVIQNIF
jgi:hypothetical protein